MSDGYPKWGKDNSSTVPNDPANQINRAKGEPQKAAPGVSFNHSENTKTVHDGTTDVVLSHMSRQNLPVSDFTNKPEKEHYAPCINPTCKSFGKSHPNCLCYAGPGGSSLENSHFAKGGCVGPHKSDCEHFADGGQVEEQTKFMNNPQDSIDHVAAQHGLLHLLTKLGHNGRSENEHKHLEDYLDASKRGHKKIEGHVKNLIGKEKLDISPDKESREALKKHIDELNQDPSKMLDIGGKLGGTLPLHAAVLGSRAANAVNYLKGLKPTPHNNSPLDTSQPVDKASENHYNRSLDIAQTPHLILQNLKDGTIKPSDLATLKNLYPDLAQSITEKAGDALIDAKTNGTEIPYHQKQGLSQLLGQPLDSTMMPQNMQAIMLANSGAQSNQSQGKPNKKASGVELKQLNKTGDLLATADQSRLMDKKS